MQAFCRKVARRSLAPYFLSLVVSLAPSLVSAAAGDPPPRVGRIAYVQGAVSFRPSPQDEWAAAVLNMPLAPGTSIWTEPGARAEIDIGGSHIRLDGGTEIDVQQLDYQTVQLNMPEGRVDIHLGRKPGDENYVVALPRGTAGLNAVGDYRAFAGDQDNPTRFATFAGESQIALPNVTLTLGAGQEAIAAGDPPQTQTAPAQPDGFDSWAQEREQRLQAQLAAHYVSPAVTGYEDLDTYGRWQTTPDYGAVWIPTSVTADWQPYRYGHWASVQPWGWTWVDDAPWGFAPFHYGRWARIGGNWGWVPGEVVERPVYAPAEVAWMGDPGALAAGAAIGAAVAWLALGPGEVYHPWYHTDQAYFRDVNRGYVPRERLNNITINNTTVVNNYANRQYTTIVSRNDFVNARPIQRVAMRTAPNTPLRVVQNAGAVLPQPTAASRLGPGGGHAPQPTQARFAAARLMQTTDLPAVPVAGRFGHGAVHATPAAAAHFQPMGPHNANSAPAAAILRPGTPDHGGVAVNRGSPGPQPHSPGAGAVMHEAVHPPGTQAVARPTPMVPHENRHQPPQAFHPPGAPHPTMMEHPAAIATPRPPQPVHAPTPPREVQHPAAPHPPEIHHSEAPHPVEAHRPAPQQQPAHPAEKHGHENENAQHP